MPLKFTLSAPLPSDYGVAMQLFLIVVYPTCAQRVWLLASCPIAMLILGFGTPELVFGICAALERGVVPALILPVHSSLLLETDARTGANILLEQYPQRHHTPLAILLSADGECRITSRRSENDWNN